MYRVVYMSRATRAFSDKDLEKLLESSKKSNSEKNLTGILIVKGRTFLQCLEGEKNSVIEVYEKIKKDKRHNQIIDLIEEDTDTRLFPNWSMGYKNLRHSDDIKSDKIMEIINMDQLDIKKREIAEIIEEFISFS